MDTCQFGVCFVVTSSESGEPVRGHALLDDVSALLDDVLQLVGPTAEPAISPARARLGRPLTVAVAGRTNAGKSTLVNALIGTRIAPTRATECTRVITWFRFGPDQSQVICTDGAAVPLWRTPSGQLPNDLPVPTEQVARLEVSLDYEPLRAVTVIDTPGLSGDEGLADQTERLLAEEDTDALLFVFGRDIRDDERRIVSDYRRRTRWLYDFPANAHGVVSRADLLGGPQTAWATAQSVATAHAGALATELAGVLPVMGKLAETTETGSFTEEHARWLRTVAALPADERAQALRYANAFLRSDVLTRPQRQELLERLDFFGVTELTTPAHAHSSASDMVDALRTSSGISALRRRIDVLFIRTAPIHKAVRALSEVEKLLALNTKADDLRDKLLDRMHAIRKSPAMHAVAELKALVALYTGRCDFGDPTLTAKTLRLFENTDPAERLGCGGGQVDKAATESARYWRALASHAIDPVIVRVAQTAARSAYLLRADVGRSK